MGVNADGRRELLGIKVGDSESEIFWAEFVAHLKERGLAGVRLAILDAHAGLTKATPPGLTQSHFIPSPLG